MKVLFLLMVVGLGWAQDFSSFSSSRGLPSNFFRAPVPQNNNFRQQDTSFQQQNRDFIRSQQAIIERQRAEQRRQSPAAFNRPQQFQQQPQQQFRQQQQFPQQTQQFGQNQQFSRQNQQFGQQNQQFSRQNQQFGQQNQQFGQNQQFRPSQPFNQRFGQPSQQPRPTFLNNQRRPQPTFLSNNNQFKPQTGGQNQIQASGKSKKQEVDPSTLNPPTETNPSPTNDQGRRFVAQPQPEKCRTRKDKINARHGSHGYYATWLDAADQDKEYDWLDARNYCRQRCMDSVSIETPEENKFVQDLFMEGYRQGLVSHVWTSGRVCDFDGCDRPDLQPIRVNGWFWPATNGKIALSNDTRLFSGWSKVGGFPGQGQPDNRQGKENCIALLNPDVYKEPDNQPHWHDVKCEFRKKMLCEDNDNLLGFVRQENPNLGI